MRNNILYKYRNLDNFEFIVDILLNEHFYASTYYNLNDPMEGMYNHYGLSSKVRNEIKNAKEKFKICSLSEKKDDPLLWAHYANGSRGICIGAKITGHYLDDIKKVIYTGFPTIKSYIEADTTAKDILTYKDESWKYESEVRVFTKRESDNTFVKVKIEEIILGKRISKTHKKLIEGLTLKLLPKVKISNQPK